MQVNVNTKWVWVLTGCVNWWEKGFKGQMKNKPSLVIIETGNKKGKGRGYCE
jgi:hypothetical protein